MIFCELRRRRSDRLLTETGAKQNWRKFRGSDRRKGSLANRKTNEWRTVPLQLRAFSGGN